MGMLINLVIILLVLLVLCLGLAEFAHRVCSNSRSVAYRGAALLFYRAAVLLFLLFITVMVALSLDGLVLLSDGIVQAQTVCTAAAGGQP